MNGANSCFVIPNYFAAPTEQFSSLQINNNLQLGNKNNANTSTQSMFSVQNMMLNGYCNINNYRNNNNNHFTPSSNNIDVLNKFYH